MNDKNEPETPDTGRRCHQRAEHLPGYNAGLGWIVVEPGVSAVRVTELDRLVNYGHPRRLQSVQWLACRFAERALGLLGPPPVPIDLERRQALDGNHRIGLARILCLETLDVLHVRLLPPPPPEPQSPETIRLLAARARASEIMKLQCCAAAKVLDQQARARAAIAERTHYADFTDSARSIFSDHLRARAGGLTRRELIQLCPWLEGDQARLASAERHRSDTPRNSMGDRGLPFSMHPKISRDAL